MSDGLLLVAFGDKFDRMAAKAIAYSRGYTDMPVTVLTNTTNKNGIWHHTGDVNFVYINDTDGRNRQYKTTMIDYSPYDRTLYIDADSVVQNKGIERAFEALGNNDVMLNVYGTWADRVPLSYYRQVFRALNIKTPVRIYYGAFIGFTKSSGAREFFRRWNANWKKGGIAREMPALASTVKQMGDALKLRETNNTDRIFTWKKQTCFVIQHEYGREFWTKFNMR